MKKSLLLVNFLPPSFRYNWPGKIPVTEWLAGSQQEVIMNKKTNKTKTYLIIVTDATDAVSVNFSGRCKFLQI